MEMNDINGEEHLENILILMNFKIIEQRKSDFEWVCFSGHYWEPRSLLLLRFVNHAELIRQSKTHSLSRFCGKPRG